MADGCRAGTRCALRHGQTNVAHALAADNAAGDEFAVLVDGGFALRTPLYLASCGLISLTGPKMRSQNRPSRSGFWFGS